MSPSRSIRLPVLCLLLTAFTALPSRAAEADSLLPGDTDLIVTVNVRRTLDEHKNTEVVQRYLEPWRLALLRDEKRLKQHYREQDLKKIEGITEEQFLERTQRFQAFSEALGLDPLQDIERITFGYKMDDEGSAVILVEGRFKEDRFHAAVEQLAKEYVGSSRMTRVGKVEVWQVPDHVDGVHLALLNPRVLAMTRSKNGMDQILARAAGKKEGGLSPATRTLLDGVEKEHLALVLSNLDVVLKKTVKILEEDIGKALDPREIVGKAMVTQAASWLQDHGKDYSAATLGLSIGADELRLQLGLESKKPETAKALRTQIGQGSLVLSLALKASGTELNRRLAEVLMRTRVSGKDSLVVVQAQVPHELTRQLVSSAWTSLQGSGETAGRRLTSIRFWGPVRPPPPKALEVEEVLDIAYRDDEKADPIRHRLDLFVPRGKKDYPVVMLVHGGGWIIGDNRCCGLYTEVGRFLASQGIGAVLPNYRLSPGVQHPAHVQDVARAFAWTRSHIAKHGGNPERIVLLGHSAGGHLISLLATDESYLKAEGLSPADIKGVVTVSGVYRIQLGSQQGTLGGFGPRALRTDQLFPLRGDCGPFLDGLVPGVPAQLDPFHSAFGDDPKGRAQASPVTHVGRGLPPFLIVTAEKDLPMQQDTADEFHQALLDAGCKSRLLKIEKRNHSSVLFSAISPDDPAARAIVEFVQQQGRGK